MTWPDVARFSSSRPSLHIYLFSEFAATLAGAPLEAPSYALQRLLALLLLEPRLWSRVQLAGRLYPDVPEARARQRLSHLLWQLRQWLPSLSLEATSQMVQLPAESRWLDVEAFRRAAAGSALEDWLAALALYRGDLLEGVYDDWLLEAREALYLQYVALSHRACDALWQQGQLEALLPLAERLVQQEPYDERALRTLMKAYQAAGRRGAALAVYERCVALLHDEIGVEPEPATQALAQALQSPTHAVLAPEADATAQTATLLSQAREALAQGAVTRVGVYLEQLRARADVSPATLHLLEIDLALLQEDCPRAAALLEQTAPEALTLQEKVRLAQLALARREEASAGELAAEILLAAREAEDWKTELAALLVLIRVQQRQGQTSHAARSA